MEKKSEASAQIFIERKALHYLCSVMGCAKLSFTIKKFEKWREVMVLNFNLVLKMCGNPEYGSFMHYSIKRNFVLIRPVCTASGMRATKWKIAPDLGQCPIATCLRQSSLWLSAVEIAESWLAQLRFAESETTNNLLRGLKCQVVIDVANKCFLLSFFALSSAVFPLKKFYAERIFVQVSMKLVKHFDTQPVKRFKR